MVLGCNPGKDVTIVPDGIIGHSEWHGLYNCASFEQQHGDWWQPRSWHWLGLQCLQKQWISNTDLSCDYSKAKDSEMALGRNPLTDDTKSPDNIAGHSDWHGPSCGMALGTNIASG